jgi:hypothetical protein
MKLMEQKANRSPLLLEAGSVGGGFCARTRKWRLFVATVDTRASTGTRSRNCHKISLALFSKSRLNRG